MIIVDQALAKREAEGRPIQVAVIGAGEMAKGIINQLTRYTPGVRVAVTYNRTISKVEKAYEVAGITEYRHVSTAAELDQAIQAGMPAITENLDALYEAGQVDLLLETTGSIDFAAKVVLRCIEEGKHILTFNAELDATLGPLLAYKARRAGVKYSIAEGDQPGVTLNLYREVKMRGFNPLVCINIKGMLDQYRTPETQKAFAASWGMNPVMATNFADGTKVNLEQASIANAIGFRVSQRGMNGFEAPGSAVDAPSAHISTMMDRYDHEELLANGGIVDFVIGAQPGPGVAVFASAGDPFTVKYLKYNKLGEGPLYTFYIPYHLLFFEIGSSIGRLVDFDDIIIAPEGGPKVEVVSLAKTDLTAGTTLDGIGGFHLYGECDNYDPARAENLLPIGLSEGVSLHRDIAKDQVVTLDDVSFEDPFLIDLYKEQLSLFPATAKALS